MHTPNVRQVHALSPHGSLEGEDELPSRPQAPAVPPAPRPTPVGAAPAQDPPPGER